MAKMNPPKLAMCFFLGHNFTVVGESYLTKLVQLMEFVLDVKRSFIHFFTDAEILFSVPSDGLRVLS